MHIRWPLFDSAGNGLVKPSEAEVARYAGNDYNLARRQFLKYATGAAASALIGCGSQSGSTSLPEPAPTPTPLAKFPTVFAAGDIAMPDMAGARQTASLLDNLVAENPESIILGLGDYSYPQGNLLAYTNQFLPTWGRHMARLFPATGNHDCEIIQQSVLCKPYYDFFGPNSSPNAGYYSFDFGGAHFIALNSSVDHSDGSAQIQWLKTDLDREKASRRGGKARLFAFWHHPLFSSDDQVSETPNVKSFWDAMYSYGVNVVLNGHAHTYERSAKQDPAGQADPKGIRQIIVGTGGADRYRFSNIRRNSEARSNEAWGVVQITLKPDSYEWTFVPVEGQAYKDSGADDFR